MGCLFFLAWIDIRIPHFELPETIRLEEEEYRRLAEKLRSGIQEAKFIMSAEFKQWTEVSYLLLKLMEDMDGFGHLLKAVYETDDENGLLWIKLRKLKQDSA